jgi:hypothetical protein
MRPARDDQRRHPQRQRVVNVVLSMLHPAEYIEPVLKQQMLAGS